MAGRTSNSVTGTLNMYKVLWLDPFNCRLLQNIGVGARAAGRACTRGAQGTERKLSSVKDISVSVRTLVLEKT